MPFFISDNVGEILNRLLNEPVAKLRTSTKKQDCDRSFVFARINVNSLSAMRWGIVKSHLLRLQLEDLSV